MRTTPSRTMVAGKLNQTEELRLVPWADARPQWCSFSLQCQGATVFHNERWIDVLRQAYGFKVHVAALTNEDGEWCAGLPIVQSKNPFRRGMISLPFSDRCPPLALNSSAAQTLVRNLTGLAGVPRRFEIRDFEGPRLWQTTDDFVLWAVDLDAPIAAVERRFDPGFRRNIRAALASGISVKRERGPAAVRRFYALAAEARRRIGLPVQPLRFFQTICRTFVTDAELWFATKDGIDLAAVFLLRDRDTIYYKWGPRRAVGPQGPAHLLFRTLLEEHHKMFKCLDLGRNDSRNKGLNQFKHSLGSHCRKLPYTYLPRAPSHVSSEHIDGISRIVQQLWRRLPSVVTRPLGSAVYRYLA